MKVGSEGSGGKGCSVCGALICCCCFDGMSGKLLLLLQRVGTSAREKGVCSEKEVVTSMDKIGSNGGKAGECVC